jgi:hypothetical protein
MINEEGDGHVLLLLMFGKQQPLSFLFFAIFHDTAYHHNGWIVPTKKIPTFNLKL